MFNLQQFITDHVICRPVSLFAADIEANKNTLQAEIENKSVCVIGGAGSIGSSFIRALLPFKPSKLIVIDLNENGLVELTRDLRSTYDMYVPIEYRTYTLNFADPNSEAFELVKEHDHALDPLCVRDFCEFLGYTEKEFWDIIDKQYNRDLFEKDTNGRWKLK